MAKFSNDEKTNLLFKKFMNMPSTLDSKKFHGEPYTYAKSDISTNQIWSFSSLIPAVSPASLRHSGEGASLGTGGSLNNSNYTNAINDSSGITEGYVTRYIEMQLTAVESTENSNSYTHEKLKNIIPFNHDQNGSYLYKIYYDGSGSDTGGFNPSTNVTTNELEFGKGEWVLDPDSGYLTFYHYEDVDKDTAYYITKTKPPRVSFFTYNGPVGFDQIIYSQQSTPSNPPSNKAIVYLNTSDELTFRNSSGAETNLLSGGGAGGGSADSVVQGDSNILVIDTGTSGTSLIKFTVDGSEKMRLNSDGYLGIGTTDPKKHLDIHGSSYFSGKVGIGITNALSGLHLSGNSNNAGVIHISTEYNISNPNVGTVPSNGGRIFIDDKQRLRYQSSAGYFDLTHGGLGHSGSGEANFISHAPANSTGTGELFIEKKNVTFYLRKIKGEEGIDVTNANNDVVIKTKIGTPITAYSTSSTTEGNVGLNNTMNVANAFSSVDSWLIRNLVDTPPAPTTHSSSTSATQIKIRWTNPTQFELGFQNIKVPKITTIRVDYQNKDTGLWNNTFDTTSSSTNNIIFYVASGTNSFTSSTNTYNKYLITSQQAYDFRVYGINDNDTDPKKYLLFNDLSTSVIGYPNAPTSLAVNGSPGINNIQFTWTAPNDTNSATAELDTDPPISDYKLHLTPISSTRYKLGGTTGDSANNLYDANVVSKLTGNSSNSLNATGLYPGTTYSAKVEAKNNQNASYGFNSTVLNSGTTTQITAAPSTSTGTLSLTGAGASGYSVSSGYYSLDGATSYSSSIKLLKTSVLDANSPGNLTSNTLTNFRINNTASSEDVKIAKLTASITKSGGNIQTQDRDIGGFGKTLSNNSYTTDVVTLTLSNEGDFGSNQNSGFWKKISTQIKSNDPKANFPASTNEYKFKFSVDMEGASAYHSNEPLFRVDSLNANPVVSNALIRTATVTTDGTENGYVSGILTAKNNLKLKTQFNVTNLAHFYLKNDKKHATITIKTNGGTGSSYGSFNITKDTITGDHYYYTSSGSVSTSSTKAGESGQGRQLIAQTSQQNIQFNTFEIVLSGASSVLEENLGISVIGHNILGDSSAVAGLHSSNDKIRIDTVSTTALTNFPSNHTQVRSGQGDYPLKGTAAADFSETYDHAQEVGVSNYVSEMVMYNGKFSASGSGYTNYTSGYHVFSGITYTFPNYGSLTGYRYTTFDTISVTNSTGCKLTIVGDNFTQKIESDMKLFVKVDGVSGWLDANAPLAATGVGSAQEYSGTADVTGTSIVVGTPTPNMTNYNTTGALIGKTILISGRTGNITAYDGGNHTATVTWSGSAPSNGSGLAYKLWKDGVPALTVSTTSTESSGTVKYVSLPSGTGKIYVRMGVTGSSKKLAKITVTDTLA